MYWVLLFGGVVVFAICVAIGTLRWLWHKLGELASELPMLGKRAEELAEVLALLEAPAARRGLPED